MSFKIVTWIFCITILLFSIYSTIHLNSATAQIGNWKKYSNDAIKFKFFYPPNWSIKTTHDNITGTTEVITRESQLHEITNINTLQSK